MEPRRFRVGRTGRSTPLLIPSFSSKDPLVAKRLQHLSHLLLERVLVSALDLSRGYVPLDAINGKKLVFVDSGGYEAQVHAGWSRALKTDVKPWTQDEHEALLARLPRGPHYVLTTLDKPPHKLPGDQLKDALAFRGRHKDHDIEFLLKPPSGENTVSVEHVRAVLTGLPAFASLGIAEEELGESIKERVQRVHAIRQMLAAAKMDVPIHIYGCINPVMVYLYTAAGADIFDGLGWFQHAFDQGRSVHIDDWAVTYGDWRAKEGLVNSDVDAMNLRLLDRLEASLVASKSVPDQAYLAANGFQRLPFAPLTSLLKDCGVT